jgi:NTE family protein
VVLPFETLASNPCQGDEEGGRPKIGLALGGGGARGAAHVGVLRKLEELRIPVDYIAGTSMGAIVGGFYATGMNADEVERVLVNADWADLFSDATDRRDRPLRRKSDDDLGLYGPRLGIGENSSLLPAGAIAGQKVSLLLENVISRRVQARDFNELPIPFHAVAGDLITGDMVELDGGDLPWSLRASMSVPGAFDPVKYGETLLIDGGVVRNLPVDVVREMGAEVIIAVNVEFPLLKAAEIDGLVDIINQLSTLMVAGNTDQQIESLDGLDVLITPALGTEFGSAEFERIAEAIPAGYLAATVMEQALTGLAVSNSHYLEWRKRIENCVSGPPTVHFVQLDNRSRFSDEVIRNLVTTAPGTTLDAARLARDMAKIHALGFIRSALYRVEELDGQKGIVIEVQPDQRGADFIETGMELTGNSRGSSIDLKAGYLKTDIDHRGSEFRGVVQLGNDQGVLAELYKPLDDELRWIFRPGIRGSRHDLTVFSSSGNALEEWELEEYSVDLAFGRELGRHAGIFLSASSYSGNARVQVGDPSRDNFRFDGGEWTLSAIYDRLDNRYLPSTGSFLKLAYVESDENLGADAEFEQLELSLFSAVTRGRHTTWFGTQFNTTVDDDAPLYGLYTGGGFLNMSGFERDELVGQHFGFSMLGYRYRLGKSGILPAYVGTTLEYGNAADRRGDVYGKGIFNGSFYLGYDSPLGPMYLGLGWSEEHSGLLFLRLGSLLGARSIGRR